MCVAGLDFQFFLSLGLVFSLGFTASQKFGTPAEEAAGTSKAKDTEPTEFGWIHADRASLQIKSFHYFALSSPSHSPRRADRVPLPTLAELDTGCHNVGQFAGHDMYLCKEGVMSDFTACKPSSDFSAFYGETVFVCQGGKALPRFKDDLPSA